METNKVKVNIFGQTYTIKGDAPPEYILQLSDYVNGKMEEVSANIANASMTQVAILVALNIADEYFQVKKLKSGFDSAVEEKAQNLISMLDEGLIGDIFSRKDAIMQEQER
ncbi:MAG: cell division protein ZapA [Spirochaetae bacterium HGW-Spirochaetae-1]|jgi:cell division protein ZapA|nr:MAG: cell division protein ZapA [Spirochaetae bacterium HGW-Spirochaetae-1]